MPKAHRVMAVRFRFKQKYVEVITMGKSPRGTPFIYDSVRIHREIKDKEIRNQALGLALDSLMDSPKAV